MLDKKPVLNFFLCLAFLVSAGNTSAIEIIIDKGVEDPIPVAIVPFGWSQTSSLPPIDLAAIISNDLTRSARFAAMEEQDLPQKPSEFREINFSDWRLLGMENLVIGQLTRTDSGEYTVDFRLIDVYKEKQIAGFRIPATEKQLRRTAHEISDIIYENLIGIPGAFATRIVYITVNEQNDGSKLYSLQIADADGYNPQVLLESTEPLLSPSWSPDGKKLAYVSFEGKNSAIYIQNIMTGQREKIADNPGINSAPSWSPDGERLALTLSKDGNPEIYILHLDNRMLQRVTNNRAIDTEPTWSPDAGTLAFTSDRGGNPQIYEVAVNGGRPKRLSFDGPYNARPIYSPDGDYIAVVHGENGMYRIGLLDRKANHRLIVLTESRLDESPSFAPNGHMIIYTTTGARGTALAAISTDGTVHQRLALQDGEVREPAWGPFLKR
ncbi:MAG TPA: Tol-Pal system beta propeller repeat protein TolB [Gammaproteobacteria bacterium]|nr:Tol-Pal system beta propeller repeat protein TolB [Gammaproteobacteria bacterium]